MSETADLEDEPVVSLITHQPAEVANGCDTETDKQDTDSSQKLFKFPLSRIKTIVKTVPSVTLINSDALQAMGWIAEHFVRDFSQDAYSVAVEDGKKSLSVSHVQELIRRFNRYEFLDGMLE